MCLQTSKITQQKSVFRIPADLVLGRFKRNVLLSHTALSASFGIFPFYFDNRFVCGGGGGVFVLPFFCLFVCLFVFVFVFVCLFGAFCVFLFLFLGGFFVVVFFFFWGGEGLCRYHCSQHHSHHHHFCRRHRSHNAALPVIITAVTS